jgi:hypothetical protein
MPQAERDDPVEPPEIEPVVAAAASPASSVIAALTATVEQYRLDNEALRAKLAERDMPPVVWRALGSCDLGRYTYECVRLWCIRRLIIAEKRGGRWFVDEASLKARLAMLAAFDH